MESAGHNETHRSNGAGGKAVDSKLNQESGLPPTEQQADPQGQSASRENRNTGLEPGSDVEEYNAMRRWTEETPQEGPWTDVGCLVDETPRVEHGV